jgi:Fe2+ transport system protein FeoA
MTESALSSESIDLGVAAGNRVLDFGVVANADVKVVSEGANK